MNIKLNQLKDVAELLTNTIEKKVYYFNNIEDMKSCLDLITGDVCITKGYYEANDGGSSQYEICSGTFLSDNGSIILLANGLYAKLIVSGSINYKQFGTKNDGILDDGIAIKNAHKFANANNLDVKSNKANYYIKQTRKIPILTNTDFNNATIYIDDTYSSSSEPLFISEAQSLDLTQDELTRINSVMTANFNSTNGLYYDSKYALTDLADYYIFIKNSNIISHRRTSGEIYNYQEFFKIDENGYIANRIYERNSADYGRKYKIPNNYLSIKNATFLLTGAPQYKSDSNYIEYFLIRRSKTNVENITVKFEGTKDSNIARIFFSTKFCTNVHYNKITCTNFSHTLSNNKIGSTYIFHNLNVCSIYFDNIENPMSASKDWGSYQSLYAKDIHISNSTLSRIDMHLYGADYYINNCNVGIYGICIQGYGDLNIKNTNVYSNNFINYRVDYSQSWIGDINIENCKLLYNQIGNLKTAKLFNHNVLSNYNYSVQTKIANSINVKNFEVVQIDDYEKFTVLDLYNSNGSTQNGRIIMPNKITIDNIKAKNLSILHISNSFIQDDDTYINVSNCTFNFDCQKRYSAYKGCISIVNEDLATENLYSPTIFINNCKYVRVSMKQAIGNVYISNSIINRLTLAESDADTHVENLKVSNCIIKSNCAELSPYNCANYFNTTNICILNNVYFDIPCLNNVENTSMLYALGLIKSDGSLARSNMLCFGVLLSTRFDGYASLSTTIKNKLLSTQL